MSWKIYRRIVEESVVFLGIGTGVVWSGHTDTQTKVGITLIAVSVMLFDHRRALKTIDDIYAPPQKDANE